MPRITGSLFVVLLLVGCSAGAHEAESTQSPSPERTSSENTDDAGRARTSGAPDATVPAMPTRPVVPSVVPHQSDAGNPGDVTLEPGPDASGFANDLTTACQTDADCSFGACYVPGTDENPICSKRCDTDDDCPEGALCAGPLDCTDGIGCEGYGYCFRSCQTDEECQAFNPHGIDDDVNDDEYMNPVECVAWTTVSAEEGTPTIDICIQRSEP